jgi:hypothetical protein
LNSIPEWTKDDIICNDAHTFHLVTRIKYLQDSVAVK